MRCAMEFAQKLVWKGSRDWAMTWKPGERLIWGLWGPHYGVGGTGKGVEGLQQLCVAHLGARHIDF